MEYIATVKAVKRIVKAYRMKLTLRQIYYRLVSQQLIPNTRTSYQQLSKILVKAREREALKPSAIEDRSRQVLGVGDYGYDSPEDFLSYQIERLKESGENYTRPLWTGQPYHVVIALEKDALSRLFVKVANPFRVKVFPTRGYGSFTFLYDLAHHLDPKKPNRVLYFGDFDPSGLDIERDLVKRLVKYGAKKLNVIRVALTKDHICALGLPPKPEDAETLAKLHRDTRAQRYGLDYAVELDAIEPNLLETIIYDHVQASLDLQQWDNVKAQIETEKTSLKEKMKTIKVTFGDEG